MIHIMLMFGTRPEAIKMAPLVHVLKSRPEFKVTVNVTAQHRHMLDQVLEIFDIHPEYDLNIMKHNQTLADITSEVLLRSGEVFQKEKPDILLVHGDTTTTFAASLAAYYSKIPVGHVEAGLRTHNKYSPYPEEMNRHLTGVLTDMHFAPTESAQNNLLAENVPAQNIYITGNTVIDALQMTAAKSDYQIPWRNPCILITAHRRENFGKPFENICTALAALAKKYPSADFVYPVHLNPNIKNNAERMLSGIPNMHLIEPLAYREFAAYLKQCYFIITDSGGIQEEATAFSKPVLLMREVTERPEAVTHGTTTLVGDNIDKIIDTASLLFESEIFYNEQSQSSMPFGNGTASEKIADAIAKEFEEKTK